MTIWQCSKRKCRLVMIGEPKCSVIVNDRHIPIRGDTIIMYCRLYGKSFSFRPVKRKRVNKRLRAIEMSRRLDEWVD